MWNKPWIMKEGAVLAIGLVVVGLLLQLTVGGVVWDAFRWPFNGAVLCAFLLLTVAMFVLRRRVYAFRFIATYSAAVPAIAVAVVLTVVMGLTRQTVDGTWFSDMLSFWPFVLTYVYIAAILGQVVLKQFKALTVSRFSLFTFPFSLFLHLGLFVTMTTATLGNADVQRLKMIAVAGEPEWRAIDAQGLLRELPIAVELKRFIMDTYDDGSPRRFASEVQILTKSGQNIAATVEVNKPVEVDGWKIYQYGYDVQMGPMSQYSILELVSDPWLPLVYAGIYLMIGGALCMFLLGGRGKSRKPRKQLAHVDME